MRRIVFLDVRFIYLCLLNIGKQPVSGNVRDRLESLRTKQSARTLASWLVRNLLYTGESASGVGKPATSVRHSSAALILVFGAIATVVLMIARTSTAAGSTPTAITLRSIATGSTSTGDDHVTVSVPPGVAPGDIMLAQVAVRGGVDQTLTPPASWSLIRRDSDPTTIAQAIYSHVVQASEPASYTWNFNAGNDAAAAIADFAGVNTTTPVDVNNGQANQSSTGITAPSITIPTGHNEDLLIGMFAISNASGIMVPPGTSMAWSFPAIGYGIGIAMSDLNPALNGSTGSWVATAGSPHPNTGGIVALLPVTAIVPTSTPKPTPTATLPPRPTASATSHPTPSATLHPTATIAQQSTATASPKPTQTPVGTAYYVATIGSDSASGSASAPWRTIQKAVNSLNPGQTAIVLAGNYGEQVNVTRSGQNGSPITLETVTGADVKLKNFTVDGSYWVLSGFDISNQTAGDGVGNGYGIYVTGSASFDTIENNYIHDLCEEGLFMDPGVSHITVLRNRIFHAEMAGINLDGLNNLIQGNEVWGTSQYPANNGGIFSVCSARSGADADGMRFFGQNHVVKGNHFHDIAFGSTENPNPHTDCWQTWGGSITITNILFDGNLCRWPVIAQNGDAGEEACEIEALDSAVSNITMQNNVFANMFQGLQIGAGVGPVSFLNNTFDHIEQEAIIYQDARTSGDKVIDNIFFDVGAGSGPFITSCNPTIENNDFFMRSGSPGSGCSFLSNNPMFVSNGDSTGLGADYHLQASSHLIGAGVVDGVSTDFDGVARSAPPSIGAYEK